MFFVINKWKKAFVRVRNQKKKKKYYTINTSNNNMILYNVIGIVFERGIIASIVYIYLFIIVYLILVFVLCRRTNSARANFNWYCVNVYLISYIGGSSGYVERYYMHRDNCCNYRWSIDCQFIQN